MKSHAAPARPAATAHQCAAASADHAGVRAITNAAGLVDASQSPRMLAQRQAMHVLSGHARRRVPDTRVVQRVVGPEPEGPFKANLAWARWFAAMTPSELDEQLARHGMTRESPGVALMNQVLIRSGAQPLTDALPASAEGGALVIGGQGARDVQAEAETEAVAVAETVATQTGEGTPSASSAKKEDTPDEKYEKRITVVKLTITAGSKSKQLALALANEYDEVVASTTGNDGTTKTITKTLLGKPVSGKGDYAVPKGNFHVAFKQTYDAFVIKAKAAAHLENLKLQGAFDTSLPTQKTFFDRLAKAMSLATGKGHASVKMAKVPLVTAVPYTVYGKTHSVSYLYIQPGNETEIRCYLGTDVGPFQRIHTSLTVQPGETPTAHTMVQTGSKLGIPPLQRGGQRVGFNASETKAGMGLAERHLADRTKAQCTVNGYIEGKTLEEIGVTEADKAREMAKSFNRTLDLVSKEISNGELEGRGITWLSEFTDLDEMQ